MSKKAYVGVNGASQTVKKIYVGVNGTPQKVIKGYVGVNGSPQLFWSESQQVAQFDVEVATSIRNYTSGKQVSFANAVLDVDNGKPLSRANLYFDNYQGSGAMDIYNSDGTKIATTTKSISTDNYITKTFTFTGTFNASGTELYIGNSTTRLWKVTNISFANGNTFSFAIDVTVTVVS